MDSPECLLCLYSAALGMAFEANVLVGAWGAFYNSLANRQQQLMKDVAKLEKSDLLQEEVAIEALKDTIEEWESKRKMWWIWGLCISLGAAAFIYGAQWLHPEVLHGTIDSLSAWPVYAAFALLAVAGPACMGRMALVAMNGYKSANKQNGRLQSALESKRQEKEENVAKVRQQLAVAVRTAQEGIDRLQARFPNQGD